MVAKAYSGFVRELAFALYRPSCAVCAQASEEYPGRPGHAHAFVRIHGWIHQVQAAKLSARRRSELRLRRKEKFEALQMRRLPPVGSQLQSSPRPGSQAATLSSSSSSSKPSTPSGLLHTRQLVQLPPAGSPRSSRNPSDRISSLATPRRAYAPVEETPRTDPKARVKKSASLARQGRSVEQGDRNDIEQKPQQQPPQPPPPAPQQQQPQAEKQRQQQVEETEEKQPPPQLPEPLQEQTQPPPPQEEGEQQPEAGEPKAQAQEQLQPPRGDCKSPSCDDADANVYVERCSATESGGVSTSTSTPRSASACTSASGAGADARAETSADAEAEAEAEAEVEAKAEAGPEVDADARTETSADADAAIRADADAATRADADAATGANANDATDAVLSPAQGTDAAVAPKASLSDQPEEGKDEAQARPLGAAQRPARSSDVNEVPSDVDAAATQVHRCLSVEHSSSLHSFAFYSRGHFKMRVLELSTVREADTGAAIASIQASTAGRYSA
eukprot:6187379-Pleurochrysis_carterae.AAC.3